jgi:hypothetical protein
MIFGLVGHPFTSALSESLFVSLVLLPNNLLLDLVPCDQSLTICSAEYINFNSLLIIN